MRSEYLTAYLLQPLLIFGHLQGKVSGKFVIILSVNNVLSLDDLTLLEHAAGAETPLLEAQSA